MAESKLIKPPRLKEQYTQQQMLEIAKCADPINGPMYFLENFFYIQHPSKGKMKFVPYEYQRRLIQHYHNNRYACALCSRQMGKTIVSAGYLLWYAMFVPDSTILVAAHKYSGAMEIMQRIRYAYEACPWHIKAGVIEYNKGTITFDTGTIDENGESNGSSRIVSATTTENTGRGMSISLLYLDEFAFVRNSIASEFWTSISPALSVAGRAIITSTPNSDEDQFWQIWTDANNILLPDGREHPLQLGSNGFKAFKALWPEHPERDATWADAERKKIGEERFRREFDCEPIIFEETLIPALKLIDLRGKEPINKTGQIRWYAEPRKGYAYTIALDPSLGTGGDNAAIQIFELPTFKQIGEWKCNRTSIKQQVKIVKEICDQIFEYTHDQNNIFYTVENNSLGEAALVCFDEFGEENIRGVFLSEPKKVGHVRSFRKGFNTTNKPKLAACSKLKTLVESNRVHLYSKPLISELKTFIASGGSFAAKPGGSDDLVMALLLVIRMAGVLKDWDQSIEAAYSDKEDDYVMPMPFIMI